MTEILNFEKTTEWFINQSKLWSKRGDDYKSLLYARRAYDSGSPSGKLRMAKSLYESGNFNRAFDEFFSLYKGEMHTEEVCVGIIKCLKGMSNNRSMARFLTDAAKEGTLKTGADAAKDGNIEGALAEIMSAYPDEYANKEFASVAYLYFNEFLPNSDLLLREVNFADDLLTGGLDLIFTLATIPMIDKIDEKHALSAIKTCDDIMSKNGNVYEALSLKIVCLVKLGRMEEAYTAGDELLDYPFPDDNLLLLKCANAFMMMGNSDGALDYLEELLYESYNEILVLFTAIANMNEGCYNRAKELFASVLLINPSNLIAAHWLEKLCQAKRRRKSLNAEFKYQLPSKEEVAVRCSIDRLYEELELSCPVEETEEMRRRLKHELESCRQIDFVAFVGHKAAMYQVYDDVCEWYLCNPRGALSVKRDILFEMLCHDVYRTIPVFMNGLSEIKIKINLKGLSAALIRAYVGALSTACIFSPKGCENLDDMFTNIYPFLENMNVSTETDIMSLAAALLSLSDSIMTETETRASDMFMMAKASKVAEYCRAIMREYPQYQRKKGNK